MNKLPLITIFIPIYNGSKYITETLNSIKNQKFSDYEVILVNDCSKDETQKIIEEFSNSDNRFRSFTTPFNFGTAPKVIKHFIHEIKGKYFVYSSQDDLFSVDWLSGMYSRMQIDDPDAVIPDVVLMNGNPTTSDRVLSGLHGDRSVILSGKEAFKLSIDWRIPGNALWKSSMVKNLGFYDFGMNADEYTTRLYFLNSQHVAFSTGTFYYRQNNPDAITKKFTEKSFDIIFTDYMLWRLAEDYRLDDTTKSILFIRFFLNLIKFTPAAYSKSFKTAISKIKDCYDLFSKNSDSFLKKNRNIKYFHKILIKVGSYSFPLFLFLCYGSYVFYPIYKAIKHQKVFNLK